MRKIGVLILMNILLIVFGFGYAHNELIDYTEIGTDDIRVYIRSFNTAKDIGVMAINRFNQNWEDFIEDTKRFADYNFTYDNNFPTIINILSWIKEVIKILATPIAFIINFILCLFNQLCTAIYFFVVMLLWAGGLRSVLFRWLL